MLSLRPTVYSKLKLKLANSGKLERFAKPKNGCDSVDLVTAETVSFAKEKAIASSWRYFGLLHLAGQGGKAIFQVPMQA